MLYAALCWWLQQAGYIITVSIITFFLKTRLRIGMFSQLQTNRQKLVQEINVIKQTWAQFLRLYSYFYIEFKPKQNVVHFLQHKPIRRKTSKALSFPFHVDLLYSRHFLALGIAHVIAQVGCYYFCSQFFFVCFYCIKKGYLKNLLNLMIFKN